MAALASDNNTLLPSLATNMVLQVNGRGENVLQSLGRICARFFPALSRDDLTDCLWVSNSGHHTLL